MFHTFTTPTNAKIRRTSNIPDNCKGIIFCFTAKGNSEILEARYVPFNNGRIEASFDRSQLNLRQGVKIKAYHYPHHKVEEVVESAPDFFAYWAPEIPTYSINVTNDVV